jgi:hypothetical protein
VEEHAHEPSAYGSDRACLRPAFRGIGGQSRRHQLKLIVHPGGQPMHRPNKSARSTAYHAQAQAASRGFVALNFQTHGFILFEPGTET